MKTKKIYHNHKCDICGKPATYNYQNWNHLYSIDNDGEFEEEKDWEGDVNEFYCDECAKKKLNLKI